jgi:hypothetical protein
MQDWNRSHHLCNSTSACASSARSLPGIWFGSCDSSSERPIHTPWDFVRKLSVPSTAQLAQQDSKTAALPEHTTATTPQRQVVCILRERKEPSSRTCTSLENHKSQITDPHLQIETASISISYAVLVNTAQSFDRNTSSPHRSINQPTDSNSNINQHSTRTITHTRKGTATATAL